MATDAPWRNRIEGSGEEDPTQLLANPANWRIHPKAQRQALRAMLDRVGFVAPALVNRRTGHLVDGHLRVELAIARGERSVPVNYVDLSPEEEALVLASLDPLAAMAKTDDAAVAALLDGVSIEDEALRTMFARLSPTVVKEGRTDPDDVPEQPDEATTRPGDIWLLGPHRLMCGDSGNPADLDRLMDGDTVDLVNMDPPYNVKVEPRSNNAIAAGMSDQWDADYQANLEANHARRRATRKLHEFDQARRPAGNHQALDLARHPEKSQATHRKLRAKDRPLQGDFITDEDFSSRLAAWFGNASRVLRPGGGFYIWGGYAEKPVELARLAIEYSSLPGEVVLDLFGGSGSTLIGAEQMGRRARLMEIDTLYCDVIVKRYEEFTGTTAERIAAP